MFGPDKDPLVDMEMLDFQSDKYGMIRFWKIATQVSDEFGNPLAWSVQLNIMNVDKVLEFWTDLQSRLEQDINWARYAVSYDQLLEPFDDYQQLLDEVVGMAGLARRCVDLGAGTGNATIKLLEADRDRDVWAIEANESMLAYLRTKVEARVADGLINPDRCTIIKEDVLRLEELPRSYFDAAILINVLYAVEDPKACLDQIYRVLKSGGVIALSTPHRETDVEKLFARMQTVLEQKGQFESLKRNFQTAKQVHKKMSDRIHRDSKDDIRKYIETAGFEIEDWHDGYVEAVVIVKAIKR
jgi:ubiquinone/menaquinone biosynthesis C-methylase UbiE